MRCRSPCSSVYFLVDLEEQRVAVNDDKYYISHIHIHIYIYYSRMRDKFQTGNSLSFCHWSSECLDQTRLSSRLTLGSDRPHG